VLIIAASLCSALNAGRKQNIHPSIAASRHHRYHLERSKGKKIQGLRSQPRRNPSAPNFHPPSPSPAMNILGQRIRIAAASSSTHLVFTTTLSLSHRIICNQLVTNLHIQIPLILTIRLVLQNASDLLSLLDCKDLPQIKHRLFPMRVFCVRAGTKADGFMTRGEIDIEPSNKGVDEIVATAVEYERGGEG
jgi:hypothetical protein